MRGARSRTSSPSGNDLPKFYVNNVSIDISTFDVRLRCGQIQGAEDDVLHVQEVAYVFMSHIHFLALADAINSSVAKVRQMPSPVRVVDDEETH